MKTTLKPQTTPAHVLRPSVMKAPRSEVVLDALKAERHAAAIARAAQGRATPRLIAHSSYVPHGYSGAELKPYIGRPDAQHAQSLPSRTGSRLRHPDGRVTDLAGNPLEDARSKP